VIGVVAVVRRLRLLTEEQVGAARTLRSADLQELNSRRVDALFDLQLALASEEIRADDAELRTEIASLAGAEARLASICRLVLERVDRVDATRPPKTYRRTGRME
jgi:hypothetical protein